LNTMDRYRVFLSYEVLNVFSSIQMCQVTQEILNYEFSCAAQSSLS
jgi:hypothetical protein